MGCSICGGGGIVAVEDKFEICPCYGGGACSCRGATKRRVLNFPGGDTLVVEEGILVACGDGGIVAGLFLAEEGVALAVEEGAKFSWRGHLHCGGGYSCSMWWWGYCCCG